MADFLNGLGAVTTFLRDPYRYNADIETDQKLSRNVVQFEGSANELLTFSTELPFMHNFEFYFADKATEKALLEFFQDRKGRWDCFWVANPVSLFIQNANYTTGNLVITVEKNPFVDLYKGYERLYIELTNDDVLTFKIDNLVAGPGGSEMSITLDTALDRNITVGEIRRFTFLHFVRFDKDFMDVNYKTHYDGLVKIPVFELVKEYPA